MAPDRVPPQAEYRELPPVGELLARWKERMRRQGVPAELVLAWVRESVEEARGAVRESVEGRSELPARGRGAWTAWLDGRIGERLAFRAATEPRGVVNATGIILHTNLGRAPLASPALRLLTEAAAGYCSLEMDLSTGRRCSRLDPLRRLLPLLTGAESGLAVHNNAAAVYLALTAIAAGREVIVSRGHLVEIGGSFRLPEIMSASGAKLVEVGSTNRSRISDYEHALSASTALILKVHPSNFRLQGFTAEVSTAELAAFTRAKGIPLLYDVGSGALRRHGRLAFDEPTVEQALEDGADLVCFSGDKLLGGPQAGIIVGRRAWCERLARHPVARVVRLDKSVLAALVATLEAWLEGEVDRGRIPVFALLSRSEPELQAWAERIAESLRGVLPKGWSLEVLATQVEAGGGSLPGVVLPSRAVALVHPDVGPDAVARALRAADPPVIGRIEKDRFLLETRALLEGDDERIARAVSALADLGGGHP